MCDESGCRCGYVCHHAGLWTASRDIAHSQSCHSAPLSSYINSIGIVTVFVIVVVVIVFVIPPSHSVLSSIHEIMKPQFVRGPSAKWLLVITIVAVVTRR